MGMQHGGGYSYSYNKGRVRYKWWKMQTHKTMVGATMVGRVKDRRNETKKEEKIKEANIQALVDGCLKYLKQLS